MPFSPDLAEDLAGPVVEVYAEAERLLLARIAQPNQPVRRIVLRGEFTVRGPSSLQA